MFFRVGKGVHRNKCGGGAFGQNLTCKFKTFDLLDTLKVHIQSNWELKTANYFFQI